MVETLRARFRDISICSKYGSPGGLRFWDGALVFRLSVCARVVESDGSVGLHGILT